MYPQDVGEMPDARFFKSHIAGLQYYSYDRSDEFIGRIRPVPGDRLQLIREPKNRHDKNAIEVWFHNGQHKLGHVPAMLAHDLAPVIDAGESLRAYAIDGGSGEAWSVSMMVVGEGIPEHLHDQQMWHETFRFLAEIEEREDNPEGRARAERNDEWFRIMRKKRRKQAADVFAPLLVGEIPPPLTPPKAPPKKIKGKVFSWWDHIPNAESGPVVRTLTQWGADGFKIRPRCKPYAFISYGSGRRFRRYELFGGHQVVPKKPLTAAQIAAGYARDLR